MSNVVHDNKTLHRFEIDVEGHIAFASYVRTDGVVTFVHTVVPEALGGRGVGSQLAKGALDLVREEGAKVVAECPFIAAYIKKHAEFQDMLVQPLA